MNTGVTNTLPSTPLVYTTGSTVIGVETNPATASAGGTNTANTEEEKSVRDLAPSYFENAVSGGNSASLGEVASHLKSARGMLNTRMFTNEDVARVMGSKRKNTMARNMSPVGPGTAQYGITQKSNAPAAPNIAQPVQSATQSTPSTANPAGSQTIVEASSTTPQVSQKINQGPHHNDAQEASRLPATSTLLPLLGLLGLVSAGIAYWFRKDARIKDSRIKDAWMKMHR